MDDRANRNFKLLKLKVDFQTKCTKELILAILLSSLSMINKTISKLPTLYYNL